MALLDQGLAGVVAGGNAACDEVVEFVGVELLVGRAVGDPEVVADEAVEVDAGGRDAEGGQGAAVDLGQHRAVWAGADVERLVAPPQGSGLGQVPGETLECVGGDTDRVSGEGAAVGGGLLGEAGQDPADVLVGGLPSGQPDGQASAGQVGAPEPS